MSKFGRTHFAAFPSVDGKVEVQLHHNSLPPSVAANNIVVVELGNCDAMDKHSIERRFAVACYLHEARWHSEEKFGVRMVDATVWVGMPTELIPEQSTIWHLKQE